MMLVEKIGEGAHGQVYLGCFNKACVYKYALKKTDIENLSTEYKINTLIHALVSDGVVRPIAFVNGMILSDYVPTDGKITPTNFKKVFKKILKTLITIKKKYPSFRHNDLSWKNVFLDKSGNVLIGDFGLANIELDGYRNPIIQSDEFKYTHGTYPENDPKFDIHFFLNSLYVDIPELRPVVSKYLPQQYRGIDGPKLRNARLKHGVSHNGMPSLVQLFSKLIVNESKRGTRLRKSSGQRKGRS